MKLTVTKCDYCDSYFQGNLPENWRMGYTAAKVRVYICPKCLSESKAQWIPGKENDYELGSRYDGKDD